MNMHITPQRTAAETALLESFDRRLPELPGNGAVKLKREVAADQLRSGLPTRRVEAWHYTDLRRLLTHVPEERFGLLSEPRPPLVEGSETHAVILGRAHREFDSGLGSQATPLREKLEDGSFAPALEPRDSADVVGAINAAFVEDGFFVEIPAGRTVEKPIELQTRHLGGQVHVRFAVRVGAGARATVIERHDGAAEALVSCVDNILLGEGAEITWIILQEQAGPTTHLGQLNAELGKDAKLRLFVLNAGGKLVRQEVRVKAGEEGSAFTLRGVNLLAGDTHCDVTMVLDHAAPHTNSTEIVRNVVTDRARGVFQGQIRVAREAQKTDAKMACNTLLLSDDAEFSTKPELEIFADDVACGHGATVTEIERSHLFYLMARGVPEKEARGLLVKAFVAEIIEELEDEALVAALEDRLDGWFAAHG